MKSKTANVIAMPRFKLLVFLARIECSFLLSAFFCHARFFLFLIALPFIFPIGMLYASDKHVIVRVLLIPWWFVFAIAMHICNGVVGWWKFLKIMIQTPLREWRLNEFKKRDPALYRAMFAYHEGRMYADGNIQEE